MPQPQAGGGGPTLLCYEQLLDQALVTLLSHSSPHPCHLVLATHAVTCLVANSLFL
jgi:hypothetical protein